jgi:hypothetical protein
MNLTTRCQQILANRCQCINDSEPPSIYCKLHIALAEGQKVAKDAKKS